MSLLQYGKYSLFIGLGILMLLSCKKDKGGTNDQQPDQAVYKLINTGYVINTQQQQRQPYYWINEKAYALPLPATALHGNASGIESRNGTTYIAGGYEPNSGPYATLPCYWKANQFFELPTNTISSFLNCFAVDILYWNSNVYILGMVDLSPILWVISPNGNIETHIINPDVFCRTASNLQLYNNELYIGGVQKREDDNQVSYEVGFWIFNTSTKNIRWSQVEQRTEEATVFSIAVSQKGTFMAGEAAAKGEPVYPALWKNGSRLPLLGINKNAIRLNEIHMNDAGELVANIFSIETNAPLVWNIDQQNNIQNSVPFTIPNNTKGFCRSIAVETTNTAYVGDYVSAGGYHFWVVANGEKYELDLPERYFASLGRARWVKFSN
jgi:hypothetical protein